jgi:hypothetical protein
MRISEGVLSMCHVCRAVTQSHGRYFPVYHGVRITRPGMLLSYKNMLITHTHTKASQKCMS